MGGEDTQFRSKQEHLYKLQKLFLDLRFGMFIHFNMATYQNLEWGDPTAPPSMFSPGKLDTNQWLSAAKSAGMTYSCLTTKVFPPPERSSMRIQTNGIFTTIAS